MDLPRSPLFPDAALALSPGGADDRPALLPQLPRLPLILTSTLQVYVVPAEKHLFVQGFKPAEYETRPPTLLRGSLVLRVSKPNKIRAVSLTFKGTQKTDWPEGIPPRRHVYAETRDLANHLWPFYHSDAHTADFGAAFVVPAGKAGACDDVSPLSLDAHAPAGGGSAKPGPQLLAVPESSLFAASIMKIASSTTHSLSPVSSFVDLATARSAPQNASEARPGYFPPGDYVYNFEHPLPALSPETVQTSFGSVSYHLEASVTRHTTFKSHLSGQLPITVVRVPSDHSVEENEPIVIERDWEDQMRYEIVVASKSVVLDSYLPMSLKFVPLFGKVALHRIRVYITEDCSYSCSNNSVQRTEPSRKYLLLEHKAGKNQSLLLGPGALPAAFGPHDEVLPRELEFQMFVPSAVNRRLGDTLHPDTAVDGILCHHWIKISLRISKHDPLRPEKRKHYEILIDSPIHLYSPLAAHNNTLLPVYHREPDALPTYSQLPPASPNVTVVDASGLPSRLPIQFHHIASSADHASPMLRDADMHLDSNLYRPANAEVLSTIGSPQATALSPAVSPVPSPGRGLPEPSMDPPHFSIMGVADDTLPPAYEERSPSVSLSPLRLDSAQALRHESSSGSMGIKDKLNMLFDTRGSKPASERASLNSTGSSEKSRKDAPDASGPSGPPRKFHGTSGPSATATDATSIKSSGSTFNSSTSKPEASDTRVPVIQAHAPASQPEQDVPTSVDISTDITDLGAPPSQHGQDAFSRKSSICLTNYRLNAPDDYDLNQTLPLLSPSSTRNNLRLLVDSDRQHDPMGSMTDLVTSNRFDELRTASALPHFRNRRLSKHYADDMDDDGGLAVDHLPKPRQKSFGVIPAVRTDSLDAGGNGSQATLSQISHSPKDVMYKEPRGTHQMTSN